MGEAPILLWFRRDLRLHDHPMLAAAEKTGRPVIPVFIRDATVEALGAAAKWRLGAAIAAFAAALERRGLRLILRTGKAEAVLRALVAETGAGAVWWSRYLAPDCVARDRAIKAGLKAAGIDARSFPGFLLFEPWEVATGAGGEYKVYSPYWRAVAGREIAPLLPPPGTLAGPAHWPASEAIDGWALGAAMNRGAGIVAKYATVGEEAALDRLDRFLDERLPAYAARRDFPAEDATSGLSENLTYGEIAPARLWHAARNRGGAGVEKFLKELVWREFAWHLFWHAPQMDRANWRAEWDDFAWRGDNPDAERWRRGMTGEPFVDAAMREMFVTGRMHNRARMIAASYLTKHLLTDWRVGLAWFADCLTDWDPAANAMGWQWVAGSGPDAAPYFRVFNPALQAKRFDPDGAYRRAWIAEGQGAAPRTAHDYFVAVPRRWRLSAGDAYPEPVVALDEGRARALAAYEARGTR